MLKKIPSTLVVAALCLIAAAWPSVQAWSDINSIHHYLVHGLYLVAGGLLGLQTSWWVHQPASLQRLDEAGVSS